MKLRNELINCIEQGLDNKDIISYIQEKEYTEQNLIEELIDDELNEDIESTLNRLREKIQSNNKFYKDINKHDIISHLGHVQKAHVKASNDLYRVKQNLEELKQWVTDEVEKAELLANVQKDEHVKGVFLGEKIAFEIILRQIEGLK